MQVRHLILWLLIYSRGDIMSSHICGNTTLQSCPKRESVRIQFHRIASKGKVLRIQFSRIASKEVFWEYNSVELPQKKCFENTFSKIPQREYFENTMSQNCLKWNILIIQFCRIASKKMFWEYNFTELPKRRVWKYNSRKLPQMKCFENTIL